jgi:hypothetical protein
MNLPLAAYLRRNSFENYNRTHTPINPTMVSFRPLQPHDVFYFHPIQHKGDVGEGMGGGGGQSDSVKSISINC